MIELILKASKLVPGAHDAVQRGDPDGGEGDPAHGAGS